VDLSQFIDDTNYYVTGGTVNGTDLILGRNGGLLDVTIDTSSYFDNTDNFVTGATMNSNTLELSRSGGLSNVTVDLSQFVDDTNDGVVSGATMNSNTLELGRTEGLSNITVDLSQFIPNITNQNFWIGGTGNTRQEVTVDSLPDIGTPVSDDYLMVWDTSNSSHKKVNWSNVDTYNNVVIVNSLSDLPTAIGGKRDFLPNKKYFITSPLAMGTDYWNLGNNTVIDTINHNLTTLTYTGTGAAIRGTNISATLRELNVTGTTQVFAFSGTGVETIRMFQSRLESNTKLGTFTNVNVNYKNNTHKGNTDGITITSGAVAIDVIIESLYFSSTDTGTQIKVDVGSYDELRITSCDFDANVGTTSLDINELGITIQEIFFIALNTFTGTSPTRIANFNPLNSDINSVGNVGIYNNEPHSTVTSAEMFAITNPTTGLPFYNSTLGELVYWDGTKWDSVNDTTIFNEQLVGDFETGLGGFVLVNGGENNWVRGTVNPASGTYSLYISNNGGASNVYGSTGTTLDVSHAYIDVLMPAATSSLALSFDWLCEAELNYDWLAIYDVPTTTTPVANTELTTGQIGLSQYNNQLTFINSQIALPLGEAGTTRRIVFSWRNDSTVEYQPPANIDNVKILYL